MRKKLLTLFGCFAAIPLLVIYFVFSQIFNSNIERNIKDMYTTNIANAAEIVENYFNESIELSTYPLIEPHLSNFYTADSQSDSFTDIYTEASHILTSSPYVFGGIRSVTMLRKDQVSLSSNNAYYYNSEISPQEQTIADSLDGKAYWNVELHKGTHIVYITRLIKLKSSLSQKLGYIKTSTIVYELANSLKKASLEKDSSYVVITKDLIPLLSTNPDESYVKLLQEQGIDNLISLSQKKESTIRAGKYFISAAPIQQTPFYVCSVIKPDSLMGQSTPNQLLFPIAVLTLFFFLILAILFSSHITKPLVELGNKMTSLSTGDFSVRANINGKDEISCLAEQFNYMGESLEFLYNKVYQTEIELNKAQLIALQSQINPHFLYNTIDTIYWMAQMRNTDMISRIASNMSRLFRLTITPNAQNQIPLSEELEHLNCYMEIQKIRYEDSVKFSLQYDPKLKHLLVLKLLLQPLVENALIHGLQEQEQESIHVRIYSEKSCLFYEVRNNGFPISVSHIEELLHSTDLPARGLALRNIDRRLKLQYGDSFGLKYGIDGEFSYFIICQPLITRPEKDENE